jgi:hypothetical protein
LRFKPSKSAALKQIAILARRTGPGKRLPRTLSRCAQRLA